MTARRSRVPDTGLDTGLYQFLDAIDKRQQRVSDIEDLDTGATTAEIVAIVNQILAAHRTR